MDKRRHISAFDYFEKFNEIIVYRIGDNGTKTYFLKEIMNYDGVYHGSLFSFLCWLISNNDREVYFCGQCNIKFKHAQSNFDMLKVVMFPNSSCMIHKSFNEWTAKVIVQWERHCVKQRIPMQLISDEQESSELVSAGDETKNIIVPLDMDMYAMFQSVVVESLNLEKKYSKSLLAEESLLSNDLLEELQSLVSQGKDFDKDRLLDSLQTMSERIRILREKTVSQRLPIRETLSFDSVSDFEKSPPMSPSHKGSSGKLKSKPSFEKLRSMSDEEYVQSVFRSNKSLTDLARLHQSHISRSLDSTESMGSQSYNNIMSSIPMSDSVSTIGDSHPIEESESMKHLPPLLEREEKEDIEEKEDGGLAATRPTLLQINVSNLPTDPVALARLFNIENKLIFEGELVAKKSSSDFMYKKRYLWLCPATRSLHWAKSAGSKEHSKFYLLKRMGASKPLGMIKGVVHSAEFGPKGLVIGTEAGDNLELKLPKKSLYDWQKVFLALIG